MTAIYICDCEHPKSQHKRERDGCRALDCGCAKFEADMEVSAAAQGVTPRHATGGDVVTLATMSGELRRAENERDALAVEFAEVSLRADAHKAAQGRLQAEQDDRVRRLVATGGERDRALETTRLGLRRIELLEAELVSARTELEQLRNRPMVVSRDGGRRCERCEGEIRRGQAFELLPGSGGLLQHLYCPDADVVAPVAGAVISQQIRHLCETCGARYGKAFTDHEHGPLTPVTVTITRGVTTA